MLACRWVRLVVGLVLVQAACVGAPVPPPPTPVGAPQLALHLDGAGSYVEFPSDASIAGATALTVEAWIRPTALQLDLVPVVARPGYQFGIEHSGTGFMLVLRVKVSGTWYELNTSAAGPLALSQWYHVAWTYDGATVRLWVNGVEQASLAQPGELHDGPGALRIGNQPGYKVFFVGDVDEVRISNVRRSISPSATPLTPDASTLALWHLDGSANDALGRDNGTLVGTPTWVATAPVGSEPVPLSISELRTTDVSSTTATLAWTTTAPSSSQVVYASGAASQRSAPDGALTTAHSVKIAGLAPGTRYDAQAVSVDAFGRSISSTLSVTTADESVGARQGEWSPVQSWPLVAVQVALTTTGEVLMWDAWETNGTRSVRLWDPVSDTFRSVPNTTSGLFCAGYTALSDGRLLVIGGHNGAGVGITDANLFDPSTGAWTQAPSMALPRWYPTATRLPDGRVLALGGLIDPSTWADNPEIYDPASNAWTRLDNVNTAGLQTDKYDFSFVLPNGTFFSMSGANGVSKLLDVSTFAYTTAIPDRSPVLHGSPAMYRPGKLLLSGGGHGETSEPTAAVADLTSVDPTWRSVAPMAYARTFHNLVPLPDGNVLAVGGSDRAETNGNDQIETPGNPQLAAELWSPDTETWTTLASGHDAREYHSTAILLRDGRVLVAGGGRSGAMDDYFSAEIFSPPYLFKGPRPVIASAPQDTGYGAPLEIQTPDAASVSSVVLTDLGQVTHSVDMDQHYVPLAFARTGETITARAPIDAALAPPGYYLLWLVNAAGVPSIARVIHIAGPSAAVRPPAVSLSAPSSLSGADVSISISASSELGIHDAQLEIDGVPAGPPRGSAPYTVSLDTTTLSNGQHRLSARASDTLGHVGSSTPVVVTVTNAQRAAAGAAADAPPIGAQVAWTVEPPLDARASVPVLCQRPRARLTAGLADRAAVATGSDERLVHAILGVDPFEAAVRDVPRWAGPWDVARLALATP